MFADLSNDRLRNMFREVFGGKWARAHGAEGHHGNCRDRIGEIGSCFRVFDSANKVFENLTKVEGIGAPIASWIMWAYDPEKYIGFDSYTFGKCIWEHSDLISKYIGFSNGEDSVRIIDYEKICTALIERLVGEGKEYESTEALIEGSDGFHTQVRPTYTH